MTPQRCGKELLIWALVALAILTTMLVRECVGDELPAFPQGFEIEDSSGEELWCFSLTEHKDLASIYSHAFYCRKDGKVREDLITEMAVENELLRQQIDVVREERDEHATHAETVELLLKETQRDTRVSHLKGVTKTVAIVILGVATAALGGALIYESAN